MICPLSALIVRLVSYEYHPLRDLAQHNRLSANLRCVRLFLIGVLIGLFVLFPLSIYLYVRLGYLSLATTARPMPMEAFLAQTALRKSIGAAVDQKSPLAPTDENLLTGAKEYREHCALCHGISGQPKSEVAAGMFPKPPQFFERSDMLTADPEGATNWIIKNGIRFSGMPAFPNLSDEQRWSVVLLLKHADKLPPLVQAELMKPLEQAP